MRENLCNQNKCIIFATSLREGTDLGSLLSWKEERVSTRVFANTMNDLEYELTFYIYIQYCYADIRLLARDNKCLSQRYRLSVDFLANGRGR